MKYFNIIFITLTILSCRNDKNSSNFQEKESFKVNESMKSLSNPFNENDSLGVLLNNFYTSVSNKNKVGDLERNVYYILIEENQSSSLQLTAIQLYYYEEDRISCYHLFDNSLFVFSENVPEKILRRLAVCKDAILSVPKSFKPKDSVPIMPYNPSFIRLKLINNERAEILEKRI